MGDKPIETVRAGCVKASIWKKEKDKMIFYSIKVIKSYKDGDEWKETDNYNVNDLPKVEYVVRKAQEFIYSKEKDDQ